MIEPLSDDLKQLATDAAIARLDAGIPIEEAIESIKKGIKNIPHFTQLLVDNIVSMQASFPMPRAGWEAFVRDIEHTNKKHGLNLVIKPELLYDGLSVSGAMKAYSDSLNKAVEELSDDEKKQAILNAVLEKGNDSIGA